MLVLPYPVLPGLLCSCLSDSSNYWHKWFAVEIRTALMLELNVLVVFFFQLHLGRSGKLPIM